MTGKGKGWRKVKLPQPYFFLDRELSLIVLKLGQILSNLQNFEKVNKFFETEVTFYTNFYIYQHFLRKLLLVFVRLQTFEFYFFFAFWLFLRVSMSSPKKHFHFRNILLYFGLEGLKSHKIEMYIFFSTHLPQICNKSNPLMQLDSIFYKTVNKNKLRVWKFQSVNCNWSGSGMGGFILLSLFSSVFERARKHQLSSIYNTKLTSNINKITTSFI